MSLYELLEDRRAEILELCRTKMTEALGLSPAEPLHAGLIELYDALLEVVRLSFEGDSSSARQGYVSREVTAEASRRHARESHRMGYTITQLVRGYGSVFQGITEYALVAGETITSAEFAQLNLCLDVAIAQAVEEFQTLGARSARDEAQLRVGSLVHEIRNYLTSAVLAHELIRMGEVGAGGATSAVLSNALRHMREVIDRSIAELRLETKADLSPTTFRVVTLLSEVESSLASEANAKLIRVRVEADPGLEMTGDEHLMVSAVTNLVQNAIKFTGVGGFVWIRAFEEGGGTVIEVEDRCGGLPEGMAEGLFRPFVQGGRDRTGLGLGLAIVQQAAEANGCALTVRNIPGVGCVFGLRCGARKGAGAEGVGGAS